MLTFQQLIQKLAQFWEAQGCLLIQGHNVEVGAATFNPATFLRCLGPSPFGAAWVEPSKRPQDGRFGENPNRIQLFHQYQVVIKPPPAHIQELYLDSLRAVGINLAEHDIRFVHDDWESPTLGAWGLGWEVWLDGMEITQFTYFQAVGSLPLQPITVELAYGLERLAMYVQGVKSFFDMKWNEQFTFRDIIHQSEVEWSSYNFLEADTGMWKRHFDDFEKEGRRMVERALPIPAYDFVLKASHAFNMLDARGVISTTERAGYIGRIRDLAREAAVGYLAAQPESGNESAAVAPTRAVLPTTSGDPTKCCSLLLEIGSEELPAAFIPGAVQALESALSAMLKERGISFGAIESFGAPRRLALLVNEVAGGTEKRVERRKGPALSACFDEKGAPTQQLIGFAKGVDCEAPQKEALLSGKASPFLTEDLKGVSYLFVDRTIPGIATEALLAEELPRLILALPFPKRMHWDDSGVTYARPLHWVVALLDDEIIPFQVGHIASGRASRGHRQRDASRSIQLQQAADYEKELESHFVMPSAKRRYSSIVKQLEQIESAAGATAICKEKVMRQVLYLSEWPELTTGSFAREFLEVPEEILISEMVEHQKYFPLQQNRQLINRFVITADNSPGSLVVSGNEGVLSARLADGRFLYREDLKQPLDFYREKLKQVTFQKSLGSVWEKSERLVKHTALLLKLLGQEKLEKPALRAAELAKADLTTTLVGEFPELQGAIGRSYALTQGELPIVAQAIEEHWMPASEESLLPASELGAILSLADRIDNLLGCFSVGLKPTSSSDPQALRRQTLGLLRIILERNFTLNLRTLLEGARHHFAHMKDEAKWNEVIEELLLFITTRARTVLQEMGFAKDAIEASLVTLCVDPCDERAKLQALEAFRRSPSFAPLFEVYKRAKGQLEGAPQGAKVDESHLKESAEQQLYKQLLELSKHWKIWLEAKDYAAAYAALAKLQQPLDRLFEEVHILADEPALRRNRLALLQQVFAHFDALLDFGKLKK